MPVTVSPETVAESPNGLAATSVWVMETLPRAVEPLTVAESSLPVPWLMVILPPTTVPLLRRVPAVTPVTVAESPGGFVLVPPPLPWVMETLPPRAVESLTVAVSILALTWLMVRLPGKAASTVVPLVSVYPTVSPAIVAESPAH